tara:strand:- start:9685 stop:10653 length:969 start_codon:yes stop_codon:yes gene_type:complete
MTILNINYEDAREEYLLHLKKNPGLIRVIEFGEIKSPGLSDIDWLIVYDKEKTVNKKLLLPKNFFSMNFINAFQHRPIFLDVKFEKYLGEFILPTSIKTYFGSFNKEQNIFSSFDEEKRNITIGFEFFKRQKKWLRQSIFNSLTLKKKIALFVSIAKHSTNPVFKTNDLKWGNFENEIYYLRSKILKNNFDKTSIEKLREKSIKCILKIEKILNDWILNHQKHFINEKQYFRNIIWSENIIFDNENNTLIKNLKLFPILFKNEYKEYGYFFKKYILLQSICYSMRSIGLKDGIIADLGFDNWFPKSFRDHAHIFKTHLKKYL